MSNPVPSDHFRRVLHKMRLWIYQSKNTALIVNQSEWQLNQNYETVLVWELNKTNLSLYKKCWTFVRPKKGTKLPYSLAWKWLSASCLSNLLPHISWWEHGTMRRWHSWNWDVSHPNMNTFGRLPRFNDFQYVFLGIGTQLSSLLIQDIHAHKF